MKVAEITKLELNNPFPPLEEISDILDRQREKLAIDTINWPEYSYKPGVKVAVAYSDSEIFLKYYVSEDYFKAEMTEPNQNVYEDSCVEFFVSPMGDGIYYNFEFNGIGTCLLGTGTCRQDSRRADPEIISRIRRLSSVGNNPVPERTGKFEWTLTVAISYRAFFHHDIKDLKGKIFRANFYKCGDGLKVPHYVTWNTIGTQSPDFHRPEFFGTIKFI
jgi:hypothetical protein